MLRNLPLLALACTLAFGTLAHAQDGEAVLSDLDLDAPEAAENDPRQGLVGEFSAGLLYSDEFGLTGTANLKYNIATDPARWISAGMSLAEHRRSARLGYHHGDAVAGAALGLSLRGHSEDRRDYLPFDIQSVGAEARLSWDNVAGGTFAAALGYAKNRIDNPEPGLSSILTPDLGETERRSLGLEYSRTFGFDSPALSRARLRVAVEGASISDGRDQWRGEVSALLGGQIGTATVWRGDLRLGQLTTNGGASSIGERYILGPDSLRGFEYAGFGPMDGTTALGGNRFAVARFDMMFPRAFGAESWLMPGLHADVGALWGLDYTDGGRVDDRRYNRSSIGATLSAKFEQGSISLNLSHTVDKRPGDRTQELQLIMQTRF